MWIPFEIDRLRLYRRHFAGLGARFATRNGITVVTRTARPVPVNDGYREADFTIDVTIGPDHTRTVVIMSSTVEAGRRRPLADLRDGAARNRARRYAAELADGAYFGVTDGNEVTLAAMEPTVRFEVTCPLAALPSQIEAIVDGERRLRDIRAFAAHVRRYHDALEPHVRAECADRIRTDDAFAARVRSFLGPTARSDGDPLDDRTVGMLAGQATLLLIDRILVRWLLAESNRRSGELDAGPPGPSPFVAVPPVPSDGPTERWAIGFWDALDAALAEGRRGVSGLSAVHGASGSPLDALSLSGRSAACAVLADLLADLRWTGGLADLFAGPLLAVLYEELLPSTSRSRWGQVYTPAAVARLIAHWGIRTPETTVFDPACGTGRFLISAYDRLVDLGAGGPGDRDGRPLLDRLHGIDVNRFPAQLAIMALRSMDPNATDAVKVDVRDFFRPVAEPALDADGTGDLRRSGQVDTILMNPPYTRQETLPAAYKRHVREIALADLGPGGSRLAMARHAPLSVYFLTHATRFVREGGRVGLLAQHAWLDARYGRDVRAFLLDNYRIVAVVGTRRDRLIRSADVNTVVLLLEREPDPDRRATNEVRFVRLDHPPEWYERRVGYDRLLAAIESGAAEIADLGDDLRVVSRTQGELAGDATWNRFLRAPEVYFDRIATALTAELGDVADVTLGLTTGDNGYFYLDRATADEWDIETPYLRPLIKSPRECRRYRIDVAGLDLSVLDVDAPMDVLSGTNVGAYLDHGEALGVPDRPFVASSASHWYTKRMRAAPLLQPYGVYARHFTCANGADACVDKRLVCIDVADGIDPDYVFGYLNSTLGILVKELYGRVSLGEGALEHGVADTAALPLLDPDRVSTVAHDRIRAAAADLMDREIRDVFGELGADRPEDVTLDTVSPDRRRLDAVLLGDVLGLSSAEQLAVYRSVLALVRDRVVKGGRFPGDAEDVGDASDGS